ncbi:uncharacterized membrane-anchored protein YhcB (DUF1043 family) [Paraburkholderia youngii]|uniref:hypothetical protein n=1 Tax=Paraburkholderia youngii TaxID=2782701 RepID=UPI003D1FA6B0
MDFTTIAGVGGLVLGGAGSVFGWLVRRAVAQNDQKIQELSEENKAQDKALADYKLFAERHFATSDELTKVIGNLDGTIKRLIESVDGNAKEMREWFRQLQQTKADK